jgi:hypothetical protein
MKQDNRNKVSVIQRNLDESLSVNPIENGNDPTNSGQQGYMYTSEIDNINLNFSSLYTGFVESIVSKKSVTGNNDFFELKVIYIVPNLPTGGHLFGNNLVDAGDAFVLSPFLLQLLDLPGFNYVKGSVIKVINIEINDEGGETYYKYTLLCSVAEGMSVNLPFMPTIEFVTGAMFLTNRRIFMNNDDKAPTNLLSSIKDGEVLFSWDDPTNKAVKYNFSVRSEDSSYNSGVLGVYGNSYNFNGKVQAKINSLGEVTTVKIIDPGFNIAWQEVTAIPIYSTLGASPPMVFFLNNKCGSLEISEYKIVDVSSIGSNTVICTVFPYSTTQVIDISIFTYIDLYENTHLGDARVLTTPTDVDGYVTVEIEYEAAFTYSSLVSAQADLIGKKFKAHTGALLSSSGSGMNKEPKLVCDKYNENVKNVIDTDVFPGPGTYYWRVASIFDCNEKSFTEWSPEAKLIISELV